MKILKEYQELVGKTIAFSHMTQFAEQITLATTDGSVLMATMEWDEEGESKNIHIYPKHKVERTLHASPFIREELTRLGIFDLQAYKAEEKRKQEEMRQKRMKEQEEKERELLKKLKAKYEGVGQEETE